MLKAALAASAVRYRHAHDLVELIDLLRSHGRAVPAELEEAARRDDHRAGKADAASACWIRADV